LGDRVKLLKIVEELHLDIVDTVQGAVVQREGGSHLTPHSNEIKRLETTWQIVDLLHKYKDQQYRIEQSESKYHQMKVSVSTVARQTKYKECYGILTLVLTRCSHLTHAL
jgi:hypothetical protein